VVPSSVYPDVPPPYHIRLVVNNHDQPYPLNNYTIPFGVNYTSMVYYPSFYQFTETNDIDKHIIQKQVSIHHLSYH